MGQIEGDPNLGQPVTPQQMAQANRHLAIIMGFVFGSVAVVALAVCYFCCWRPKSKAKAKSEDKLAFLGEEERVQDWGKL